MVHEQLLAYVRDNLRAGFSRIDIESALRTSGWSTNDIAAALAAAGDVAAPAPNYMPNTLHTTPPIETHETGIIGWMIRKKLVKSRQQANIVLIALSAGMLGLALKIAL